MQQNQRALITVISNLFTRLLISSVVTFNQRSKVCYLRWFDSAVLSLRPAELEVIVWGLTDGLNKLGVQGSRFCVYARAVPRPGRAAASTLYRLQVVRVHSNS